jgi:hypothetical protein
MPLATVRHFDSRLEQLGVVQTVHTGVGYQGLP